jgi:heme-degrading monooxygenase HmoA
MSVLVTLRVQGNVQALEARAAANPAGMQAILEKAKPHGLISHRFYGAGDEILVVDEWESEEGFRAFFAEATEIPGLMAEVGVTTEPEITFWRKLDTHDDFPA